MMEMKREQHPHHRKKEKHLELGLSAPIRPASVRIQ